MFICIDSGALYASVHCTYTGTYNIPVEKFIFEFVHSGSEHACLGDVDQSLACQLIPLFSDSLIYTEVCRSEI